MSPPSCVLFDFGDTLAAEDFVLRSPPDCPDWRRIVYDAVYAPPAERLDAWMAGALDLPRIAGMLAVETGLREGDVRRIVEDNCRSLVFHAAVVALARELRAGGVRTAIVTLNADVFSDIIVPHYRLDRDFDAIVSSSELGTLDKMRLCEEALARLGLADRFADAVLIDNMPQHVEAFRRLGGTGIHFTGAASLQTAIREGLLPMSRANSLADRPTLS